MSDQPGGPFPPPSSYPPPPLPPPGSVPPPVGSPPPPPVGYPPPAYPAPPPTGYQQHGYGWTEGAAPTRYAGFWVRVAASIIDSIILGIPVAIIAFLINPDDFYIGFNVAGGGVNPTATLLVNVLGTIAGLVYYSALEGGATGQTIGKRLCNIRVVDATTFQPGVGLGRGLGRNVAEYLSSIALLLGYLWMLWDPNKQTWHDKLARTVVVQT